MVARKGNKPSERQATVHSIQVREVRIYSVLNIPQSTVWGLAVDDSSNKRGPTSAIVTLGQDEKEICRQQKQNKE